MRFDPYSVLCVREIDRQTISPSWSIIHGRAEISRLAVVSLTLFLIAACGGGGGSASDSGNSSSTASASSLTKTPTDTWATAAAQVANFGGPATPLGPDATCSQQAVICRPTGIAVDSAGNVYAAGGNIIYEFTPAGAMTVFAGGGAKGYADGQGAAALFNAPQGIKFDASGNLLVADSGNNMIRKITLAGVVSTVAGSTSPGNVDGTGGTASFRTPLDVAVDSSGNIYVADADNRAIRKISASGAVTTLAGSPDATTFNWPSGVALDPDGNVIVMDNVANKVLKVTPAGNVTTLAGTGSTGSTDGAGNIATFGSAGSGDPLHSAITFGPAGIFVDKFGYIFVVDRGNNEIRMITPAGVVSTLAGQPGQTWGSSNGTGTAALFDTPNHIAMDSRSVLYVTEQGNSDIRTLTPVSSH
jgi:sugar lactone lactonase YvrE